MIDLKSIKTIDLKSKKPIDFRIIPVARACEGCVFLIEAPELICKITRDLDLMDLARDIDEHFKVNCYKNKIIYQVKFKL